MAREVTREQAERKRRQAVSFLERIGEPDQADEFENMSVDQYAEHRGLRLSNPPSKERRTDMSDYSEATKSDLQEQIDDAIEILDDAYEPEATREELARAIGNALDALRGDEDEEEDDDLDIEDSDTD